MPVVKEVTVHDMKTHFSQYASNLLDGTFDEIIVKNRTVPTLRILPYSSSETRGLQFGVAKKRGHAVVSDDWDINDGDDAIADMFEDELK